MRLPPILTLCSLKIDVSYEFPKEPLNLLPQNRCFVQGFRQFSAHLTKCHAYHGICTLSPLDAALPMRFAKNTQHDTPKVLRLPRKMAMGTSKVLRLPRKLQRIFGKRRKSIAPAAQNHFRHVTKHVWMSRSATPAMRNEATRRLKPPKMTPSAELTIGTAIRGPRERLRTVADGCERKNATSSEHTLSPQTPRVKREPLLRIREKTLSKLENTYLSTKWMHVPALLHRRTPPCLCPPALPNQLTEMAACDFLS